METAATAEGRSLLIGRRPELGWLRNRLRLALHGYPHLVLLEGEEGIGKTRLCVEMLTDARQSGVAVARGRAYEDLNLAYLPLRESLFRLLATTAPGLDDSGFDAASPEARSRALLELTRLVIQCAHEHPLLLFVDDIDWADAATIDLMRHLLFRFDDEDAPILLLATSRVDSDARGAAAIARLRTEPRTATLTLHALGTFEATQLAREASSGSTLADARELAQVSGGNPLLIQALARQPVPSRDLPTSTPVAHPMSRVISAQLEALSESTRRVVQATALVVPDGT